jgi:hypothetical protein
MKRHCKDCNLCNTEAYRKDMERIVAVQKNDSQFSSCNAEQNQDIFNKQYTNLQKHYSFFTQHFFISWKSFLSNLKRLSGGLSRFLLSPVKGQQKATRIFYNRRKLK